MRSLRSRGPGTRARRLAQDILMVGLMGICLVLGGPLPAAAQTKNVLVLETRGAARPFTSEFTTALTDALAEIAAPPVVAYYEWLDLDHFQHGTYLDTVRTFLADKYREHPPDVIIAAGDPAVRFALDSRALLWPGRPIVFVATSPATVEMARKAPATAGVLLVFDIRGTIEAALRLLPDTTAVAWVAGGGVYTPTIERELAAMANRVRVIRLVDLSVDETKRRLAMLPSQTVVLFTQFELEPGGGRRVGRQVLTELAPVSSAPIVGTVETYLGHGILGGSFRDIPSTARDLAGIVKQILAGTDAAAIPVSNNGPTLHFDARELRRWGIDESRIPPGSDVRFREPTLFQAYRGTMTAIGAVLAAQSVTILAMLYEVRRRREAQAQQRRLSVRVVSVLEEERRRIARELHDSAGQQLALFAIELDQLGVGETVAKAPPARVHALADRVRSLSSELHGLAYELHPAILDRLGLVPALEQFVEQFAARHGIRADVSESNWPPSLPAGVELAFYRVAQEALQNVAKHSGAAAASIRLSGTPQNLTLAIIDTGHGFDGAMPLGSQLGLAGMTERLAHIGGQLTVESSPGGGTTVTATVSRESVTLLEMDDKVAQAETSAS